MSPRPLALKLLAMLACVAIVALASGNAQASRFQVSPVRLDLSATATSGLLTVRNQSPEPLRFQVTAFAWQQGQGGEMQLLPSRDISFFPSMLTVPAGQSRKVRVGTLTSQGSAEQTYRVFVEELPPLAAAPSGSPNAVRVLTRMGIPVFLASSAPSSKPSVDGLVLSAGRLGFTVKNRGNTHFMNRTLRIVATDSAGHVTYDATAAGWYVLGAGTRLYDLPLPKAACSQLSKVTIDLVTDQGTATATLAASATQCTP